MNENGLLAILGAYLAFVLVLAVLMVITMWKIFTKAGQPGWAVFIPFYNLYVYTQVVQRPGWWMVLYFLPIIPLLGGIALLVISILDNIRLARLFGKSDGFAVGLIFLSFVFLPILAFGDAQYQASASNGGDLLDQ